MVLQFLWERRWAFGLRLVHGRTRSRTILERGTSAHWQLRTYREAKAEGASDEEALVAVVDMLIRESLRGP